MSILDYICHRKPERSFFIKGHQFPVCARCTGFYSALLIYLIYTIFYPFHPSFEMFIIGIILIIPCGIDGTTQLLGYRESNNPLRFITGIIGGFGLIIVIEFMLQMLISIYL